LKWIEVERKKRRKKEYRIKRGMSRQRAEDPRELMLINGAW
jgi:hypothetical protein